VHVDPYSAQAPAGTSEAALCRLQTVVDWGVAQRFAQDLGEKQGEPPSENFNMSALQ